MVDTVSQDREATESTCHNASHFRRHASRLEARESVYTFWSCDGHQGLSRVRDLSPSGLFIESPIEKDLGAPVRLHFLADEGQIRACAEVRHVKRSQGVGLKLVAMNQQDCQRLASLIKRVQNSPEACCAGAVGR